ncbi:hypothetical protein Rsub_00656 [Raphidocelis subcapitata]|uniref:Ataxin-10 domain-containing protein n=1 Tax=Raphidocelis subcapitata TaxID=307507 RepID=A0A2V0NKR5_9CHLO|nr:hypothetical protein Rsub_00656 [Raphidocelis subcapitata]|eukprot:GBF87944.1 hypothetical protein Rsub_00656 [Raphidocelis subcapitata]
MQPEGQPADGPGSGAALAAQIDAALDAAFAAVEAALAQVVSCSDCDDVQDASTGAVAELLVRGLSSLDASVARRAALAIARFVLGDSEDFAASAVMASSDGAVLPALARLAASGDDAVADAAWTAMYWLVLGIGDQQGTAARCAATDGVVEGLIKAVMQRATPWAALKVIYILLLHRGPEAPGQFAAADGFCARLVAFAATVGDSPCQWRNDSLWQAYDDQFESCWSALKCILSLLESEPEATVPALMAAEGLWPALEGLVGRAASTRDGNEYGAVSAAIRTIQALAEQSAAAARRAAGLDGLLARLAAALAQPQYRQWPHGAAQAIPGKAGDALRAIASRGGGNGEAAVAAAVAGVLACAADDDSKQRLRDWLAAPPMRMGAGAIAALELQVVEAAALRARVAELEAIPVNTRAAIVELAHAVRGKRRREEDEEAAVGKEQRR